MTSTPLQKSIQHWVDNLDPDKATFGTKHCALCQEYVENDCEDCPVTKSTGRIFCEGSPYDDALNLHTQITGPETHAAYVKAALAELEFLMSLPEPEPEPITLTLDRKDAEVLFRFCRHHVVGPTNGPRGSFDRIYTKLRLATWNDDSSLRDAAPEYVRFKAW